MSKFRWDGTDLGDITHLYTSYSFCEEHTGLLLFLNGEKCLAFKLDSKVPLLIDELKPLFGLPKIGRHSCVIEKTKILLCRLLEEETVYKPNPKTATISERRQIQRFYTFRYLMGVSGTSESAFWWRSGPISYREININYKTTSAISKSLVDKWFSEWNCIEPVVADLLEHCIYYDSAAGSGKTKLYDTLRILRDKIEETVLSLNMTNFTGLGTHFLSRANTKIP